MQQTISAYFYLTRAGMMCNTILTFAEVLEKKTPAFSQVFLKATIYHIQRSGMLRLDVFLRVILTLSNCHVIYTLYQCYVIHGIFILLCNTNKLRVAQWIPKQSGYLLKMYFSILYSGAHHLISGQREHRNTRRTLHPYVSRFSVITHLYKLLILHFGCCYTIAR